MTTIPDTSDLFSRALRAAQDRRDGVKPKTTPKTETPYVHTEMKERRQTFGAAIICAFGFGFLTWFMVTHPAESAPIESSVSVNYADCGDQYTRLVATGDYTVDMAGCLGDEDSATVQRAMRMHGGR